jgi:hypothetical protein
MAPPPAPTTMPSRSAKGAKAHPKPAQRQTQKKGGRKTPAHPPTTTTTNAAPLPEKRKAADALQKEQETNKKLREMLAAVTPEAFAAKGLEVPDFLKSGGDEEMADAEQQPPAPQVLCRPADEAGGD